MEPTFEITGKIKILLTVRTDLTITRSCELSDVEVKPLEGRA